MGLSALVSEPSSHCCDAWLRIPLSAGFPKFTKFSFGHYCPTDHLHSQLVGLVFAVSGIVHGIVGAGGLVDVLTYLSVITQSCRKYPCGGGNTVVTFYLAVYCTCSNRIQYCYRTGFLSDASYDLPSRKFRLFHHPEGCSALVGFYCPFWTP